MLNSFATIMDSYAIAYYNLPETAQIVVLLLSCLVPTIIIETLFARLFKVKGKNLLIVILAQIITNPIVVLTTNIIVLSSPALASSNDEDFILTFLLAMAIMELFALLVEALIYKAFLKDYKFLHPFLLSFLLNLLSVVLGFVLIILTAVF